MDEITLVPENAAKTLEWITVLSAGGLDYRLSRIDGVWHLHLPEHQVAVAQAEIHAYERDAEQPCEPRVATPVSVAKAGTSSWVAFWCAYSLFLFFVWLGPYTADAPVFEVARGDAVAMVAGEWWRSLTALTIHSGWPHLLANVFFLYFVGKSVFQVLGQGVGLLLILLGGAFGNLAVAYVMTGAYRSVGASTAGFAALGIMSAYQSLSHYRHHRRFSGLWRRSWIPMAAGMALLGFMGTGPQSDLAAHVAGFLVGALLTVPLACWSRPVRFTARLQWSLVLVAALLMLGAWLMVLWVA